MYLYIYRTVIFTTVAREQEDEWMMMKTPIQIGIIDWRRRRRQKRRCDDKAKTPNPLYPFLSNVIIEKYNFTAKNCLLPSGWRTTFNVHTTIYDHSFALRRSVIKILPRGSWWRPIGVTHLEMRTASLFWVGEKIRRCFFFGKFVWVYPTLSSNPSFYIYIYIYIRYIYGFDPTIVIFCCCDWV